MKEENDFWQVVDNFIDAVLARYEPRAEEDDLNQVFMRGPFAGWSERQLYLTAKDLDESRTKYPLYKVK